MEPKQRLVREVDYGVYVWEMPNGQWVGDDQGNFLNVAAMAGDQKKIKNLKDAVRGYGIEVGQPLFLPGHRRVTDEEFEEQKLRLALGLIPDDHDIPALVESAKSKKLHG